MSNSNTEILTLDKDFVNSYKNKQPNWGFNGLGYIVYKRTYARKKDDGTTEEWYETVERCVNGAQKIGANYTKSEMEQLYDLVFNLKCNFAGRMLWQLGTTTVDRFGPNSLLNCFAGETKVLTRQGWKEIKELVGTTQTIVTKNGKWVEAPFKEYGKQKLKKITFSDRTVIYATPEHRWLVLEKDKEIEKITDTLSKNDVIPLEFPDSDPTKDNNTVYVISVEDTDRFETVYCAEVPDTRCFVIEGNILTGNCWFISMREPKAFLFLFENLMLGGGVGFSIKREDVHELPKVKKGVKITNNNSKDATFIVPDSREGWVELLNQVLNAYYFTGKSFSYSTILVRGAGEPINGFGGTSSGPSVLVEGIEKICKVFNSREGKKLRSIDVLDICNIIGSVVVAGNVRRSAEIALGDPDDFLFLRAKNWSSGKIPNWRSMSNNTIYADSYEQMSEDVWSNGYELDKNGFAKGEPYGFFNLKLCQEYGRIKDGPMKDSKLYPTDYDNAEGVNPCGELPLAGTGECCNLVELYLNNIEDKETLFNCARLLYKTQKAICAMNFIHEETNKIVHKNMRLGMGVTGICQSLDKIPWLDECYEMLREYDKQWSKERGWNPSIKLTTVKPSGTLSLLGGATPGVHPSYAKYYIRRIRMSSDDKLIPICREAGYNVEYQKRFDGTDDHGTCVVEFPCETPDGALLAKDVDVIAQLELVKKMQNVWSDNAVSVTAYYKPEELEIIKEWLKNNYEKNIKSVSFLLHSNHGFLQAPYEEISEVEYRKRVKKVKPLSSLTSQIISGNVLEGIECEGGACPLK